MKLRPGFYLVIKQAMYFWRLTVEKLASNLSLRFKVLELVRISVCQSTAAVCLHVCRGADT